MMKNACDTDAPLPPLWEHPGGGAKTVFMQEMRSSLGSQHWNKSSGLDKSPSAMQTLMWKHVTFQK